MLLIYIAEAHAADAWPINSSRSAGPANTVLTPTSLEERCVIANRMLDALPCLRQVTLLVDGLDDRFLTDYAAWPIRSYGVTSGCVQHIGQPIGSSINLLLARRWLSENVA